MKVLTKKEFLKLPEGTLYCKGKPWYFEPMCIKGESWENDWIYLDMNWADASDSNKAIDILDNSLETGESFISQESYGRDGAFDKKDIFLVYEQTDLKKLQEHLNKALATTLPRYV